MASSTRSTTKNSFLQRFFDPALDPPAVESREQLEARQIERIGRSMSVSILAGAIPRRLGPEATDIELALDARRAKRMAHALGQSVKGWTKKKVPLPLNDSVRMEGAQIVWEVWASDHLIVITNELRYLATWSILNDQEKWGRSCVVRLENEEGWIKHAMRD